MGFLRAVFWEVVQNLPLIISFVTAVWLWTQRHRIRAVACLLIGSIMSSLIIRFTEPVIHGYYETVESTLVNMVGLSLLMFLFTVYLASESRWSNWKTDMILGGVAGILLGVAQGIASSGDLLIGIVVHSLALSLSAPVVLISIRSLKNKRLSATLTGALVITAMMTVVISVLDYSYFLLGLD